MRFLQEHLMHMDSLALTDMTWLFRSDACASGELSRGPFTVYIIRRAAFASLPGGKSQKWSPQRVFYVPSTKVIRVD